MSWFNLALLLLNITDSIVTLIKNRQQLDAGRDRAVAEAAAAILAKTSAAKAVMAEVTGLTDEQVDTMLKGLEP